MLGSGATQFNAKVQDVLELPGQWRQLMCKHPHATQAKHVRMGTGDGVEPAAWGKGQQGHREGKGKSTNPGLT